MSPVFKIAAIYLKSKICDALMIVLCLYEI